MEWDWVRPIEWTDFFQMEARTLIATLNDKQRRHATWLLIRRGGKDVWGRSLGRVLRRGPSQVSRAAQSPMTQEFPDFTARRTIVVGPQREIVDAARTCAYRDIATCEDCGKGTINHDGTTGHDEDKPSNRGLR